MRIALIQVASPGTEPVVDRRSRVASLIRAAARDGTDLVVLPELWGVGYFSFEDYTREAEPFRGRTIEELSALARETRTHLHVGSFVERLANGALRNTAVLLGPDGAIMHTYSKIHVFGYESQEARLLEAGDRISVTSTEFGAVAATTCYDLRFPELWRGIVDLGAEIVIVPAAWPAVRLAHWRLFTSARAVEEQVLLVACNAVGTRAGVTLAGHSRVVDPWGTVLAEGTAEEGITFCEVDPSIVPAVRQEFPVLDDRLPSYSDLRQDSPLSP